MALRSRELRCFQDAIGAVMAPISGQILDKLGAVKAYCYISILLLPNQLLLLLFVHVLTVEMITYIFAILPLARHFRWETIFTVALGSSRRPQGRWKCCHVNTMQLLVLWAPALWRCSGFSAWSHRLSYKHLQELRMLFVLAA